MRKMLSVIIITEARMNTIPPKAVRCDAGREKKPSLPIRFFTLLCLLAVLTAAGCGDSDTAPAALPGIDEMLSEKVLGDQNAPITMIEYSALTCPHCADFDLNTLPQIKAKYIDTGRAKLLYRDFPFNQNGLTASMLARCSGNAHYFEAIDLMFRNQASWSGEADPKNALANILGMPLEKADACISDKALEDGIQVIKNDGQQLYGVNATPTFIINGQKVVGSLPFAEFDQILEAVSP